jgi:hypothetical protein
MGPNMKRAVDVLVITVGVLFIVSWVNDTSPHPAYLSLPVGMIAIAVGVTRLIKSLGYTAI